MRPVLALPRFLPFLLLSLLFACDPRTEQANEVRVRFPTDPQSLNPVNYHTLQAMQMVNLLFQSLITVDLADDQLKPLLAESLPLVERQDSLTLITYTIRKEATWDNATPVTAQDVAFTVKVMLCPLVNNEQMLSRLEFIRDVRPDSLNPKRFTLVCRGFTPGMVFDTGDFFILPAYLYDPKGLLRLFSIPQLTREYDQLGNNPAIKSFADFFNGERFTRGKAELHGSAGYQLEDWKTGQSLRIVKKARWWGDSLHISYLTARPPAISFQIIPDNTTALLALKNGQLDVLDNLSPNDFLQLKKQTASNGRFDLYSPDTYNVTLVGVNGQLEKLADRKTRQALAHLVDLDNIIRATQQGFATPTIGIINPKNKQLYNPAIPPYDYNLVKAESLLREAGWKKNGGRWEKRLGESTVPLTLNICYRTGSGALENTALVLQQAAAKIGIPLELQPMEGRLLSESRKSGNFELYLRELSGSAYSLKFKSLFHTDNARAGGRNDTHFGTAESDSLLEVIDRAENTVQQARALQRLQVIMHEEANLLFLYFSKERLAFSKRFTNRKVSGVKPFYDLSAFTPRKP